MMCYAMIRSGMARKILLIGADRMSATINWRDRGFATVLGDAGTATLCSAVPENEDWFAPSQFWSWLDGAEAGMIARRWAAREIPLPPPPSWRPGRHRLAMDGAAVRLVLVPFMGGPAMDAALAKASWTLPELDVAILHEANLMLNESIVRMWRGARLPHGRVLNASGAVRQYHQRVDPAGAGAQRRSDRGRDPARAHRVRWRAVREHGLLQLCGRRFRRGPTSERRRTSEARALGVPAGKS
jgi:acetyl-CoA acetyltransferase